MSSNTYPQGSQPHAAFGSAISTSAAPGHGFQNRQGSQDYASQTIPAGSATNAHVGMNNINNSNNSNNSNGFSPQGGFQNGSQGFMRGIGGSSSNGIGIGSTNINSNASGNGNGRGRGSARFSYSGLPAPGGRNGLHGFGSSGTSIGPFSKMLFKRLSSFSQIDFEYASWEMFYLCVAPQRVYRNIYYRKQTKNQWARDDPAFVLLLSAILTAAAVAYGVVYRVGFWGLIRLVIWMVGIDFLLVGVIVATALWVLTNKFLLETQTHAVSQPVEWAYAFDVHCNAFFPMCLVTYVLQLFFIPIVTKDRWVCLFFGNTFYFVALSYYVFVTFLGYRALPFLRNTQVFLYPIAVLAVLYLFSLLGFNVSKSVLAMYFG